MPNLPVETQAEIVAKTITNLRVMAFRAEVTQTINGHSESDIHPESGQTYRDNYEKAREGERKLREAYPDIVDRVDTILGDPKPEGDPE